MELFCTTNPEHFSQGTAQLNPCLIAMEACSDEHYWAREFKLLGHQVAISSALFISENIESLHTGNKNNNNDAEAIYGATMRPSIWHVPVKAVKQQAVMTLHRVNQGLVKERTSMNNQLRGLLSESGIIVPKGRYSLHDVIGDILEDADNKLPHLTLEMTSNLRQRIKKANEQILSYDRALSKQVREDSSIVK